MMLIAKLNKKLERMVKFPVLDDCMAVQSLMKSCTYLVEEDMKLQEITLFIP